MKKGKVGALDLVSAFLLFSFFLLLDQMLNKVTSSTHRKAVEPNDTYSRQQN